MKFKITLFSSILLLICHSNAFAQESSSTILKNATKQAKLENKNVFIMFHASWCGWCKKMDKKMNTTDCKALFSNNYIIDHLVVNETPNNKHLENKDALALLKSYKAEKSGIPFWVILDKNGTVLANAFDEKGQNLGYPATTSEVSQFIDILRKTSHLTNDELATISKVFLKK